MNIFLSNNIFYIPSIHDILNPLNPTLNNLLIEMKVPPSTLKGDAVSLIFLKIPHLENIIKKLSLNLWLHF